jgi:hypothetical protein
MKYLKTSIVVAAIIAAVCFFNPTRKASANPQEMGHAVVVIEAGEPAIGQLAVFTLSKGGPGIPKIEVGMDLAPALAVLKDAGFTIQVNHPGLLFTCVR